jgi:hypothetical protein
MEPRARDFVGIGVLVVVLVTLVVLIVLAGRPT